MGSISTAGTLRIISDDKSLGLLNMVTFTLSGDTDLVMTRLRITKSQYYLKMNRLIKAGLVIRKRSKYFLTSFGKVVYESLIRMEQAVRIIGGSM
jgi:predicted transcriptional regulator